MIRYPHFGQLSLITMPYIFIHSQRDFKKEDIKGYGAYFVKKTLKETVEISFPSIPPDDTYDYSATFYAESAKPYSALMKIIQYAEKYQLSPENYAICLFSLSQDEMNLKHPRTFIKNFLKNQKNYDMRKIFLSNNYINQIYDGEGAATLEFKTLTFQLNKCHSPSSYHSFQQKTQPYLAPGFFPPKVSALADSPRPQNPCKRLNKICSIS